MTSTPKPPHGSDGGERPDDESRTAKEHVLEFVRELPDDISLEEIRSELVENLEYWRRVQQLVQQSRDDIEQGRTVSQKEAKKRFGIE